jgi:hypothetical protein
MDAAFGEGGAMPSGIAPYGVADSTIEAMAGMLQHSAGTKVFWFFSPEKNAFLEPDRR